MSKLGEATGGSYDLGFENPPKGDYQWQFEEGVDTWVDDTDRSKMAIKIPAKIVKVVDGDSEAVNMKSSFFCGNQKGGQKQLLALLDCAGLLQETVAKFGSDSELADLMGTEQFVTFLKIKMPGKVVGAQHTLVKKAGSDFENVRFTKIYSTNPAASRTAPQATQSRFED